MLSGDWTVRVGNTVISTATTAAVIYGPTSRTIKLTATPPSEAVSVGILPLGWTHLIGLSAARFADRLAPLSEVFPDTATSLRRALQDADSDDAKRSVLDDIFLSLGAQRAEPSSLLLRAHQLILDPAITTAEEFAAGLGRSGRQVSRLSREMFGFSPKLLLRRQRFLRSLTVLRTNHGRPWSELIDPAYYDHSHFVRDFRRFMGMSPSQYYALPRLMVDHAARMREQQIGQSHQGFDLPAGARKTKT